MHPALQGYGLGLAPPKEGERRRTLTPDDGRSIRFELDQMREYVRSAPRDGAFIEIVRDVMQSVGHIEQEFGYMSAHYRKAQLAAWYEWFKRNYQYIGDPIGISCEDGRCNTTVNEVIQTTGRMARRLRGAQEMISAITAPLRGQDLRIAGGVTYSVPEDVLVKIEGDCDEASVGTAAGPACCGIETAFRLGGHPDPETGEPDFHHVWAIARLEGTINPYSGDEWWDMDATLRHFVLGQFAPFRIYGKVFIFREG